MKNLSFGILFFLCMALPVYASETGLSHEMMGQTISSPDKKAETKKDGAAKKVSNFHFDFQMRGAYMAGYNKFNMNHHVSELKYPMNVYLGGFAVTLGYKRFSVNQEFLGSLFNDPSRGWRMEDKDWNSDGSLESYTKSKSTINTALITDSNLRYDILVHSFSRKKDIEEKKKIKVRFGGLLGYRYQRFKYSMNGMYQTVGSGESTNEGDDVKTLGYRVAYHLPYIGFATEVGNDRFGISFGGKCAIAPTANDTDSHVLRELVTFGNYRKDPVGFIINAAARYKFFRNFQVNTGIDFTFININGRLHEEHNVEGWNLDQDIRNRQFIYWVGLGYSF